MNTSIKMTIDEHKKILTLQEEFNAMFPFLKLEFFAKQLKPGESFEKKVAKPNIKTLHESRTVHNKKKVIITPEMTVFDLDKTFFTVYGLGVQVFRKSGKVWLETTLTDSWTLEEQNLQGEALSA